MNVVVATTASSWSIAWKDPHTEAAVRVYRIVVECAEWDVLWAIIWVERRTVRSVEKSIPEAVMRTTSHGVSCVDVVWVGHPERRYFYILSFRSLYVRINRKIKQDSLPGVPSSLSKLVLGWT